MQVDSGSPKSIVVICCEWAEGYGNTGLEERYPNWETWILARTQMGKNVGSKPVSRNGGGAVVGWSLYARGAGSRRIVAYNRHVGGFDSYDWFPSNFCRLVRSRKFWWPFWCNRFTILTVEIET